MNRTVYVNGNYLPEKNASVSIFDRGFLMADGVYEVTTILDGKLIDFKSHMTRLKRSLKELNMAEPREMDDLLEIHQKLIQVNNIDQGGVYLQITRGSADRDFVFPKKSQPTLVLFTQEKNILEATSAKSGWRVISIDDLRWGRRDIKTIQLLYSSMAKMTAISAGSDDAWMVEKGFVTEGTSNNAYIIKNNTIITRELSKDILHGITRASVLRYAKEAQMKVIERQFSIDEAQNSDEAFITSASTFVTPVVEIDGKAIGNGRPGAKTQRLRDIYIEESRKNAI